MHRDTIGVTGDRRYASKEDGDKEPVLVVSDKSRRLVHVGQPSTFDKKLLVEYAQKGYNIKTITIKKFRESKWKWYWEK